MNIKLPFFEKYSIAPSPNRDYYGIKVFAEQVILYQWKISHGPHLSPLVRAIKFSEFRKDKALKELIQHVFGTNVLRYLELAASSGPNTLLTLPKGIIEKLVTYLNLKDITELLRTSAVSSEVFDTEPIWRILYGQLKASANLSEMEREVAASRGFKKLVKDHQARSTAKRSMKLLDDKPKRSQIATSKTDKVARSASVNIPKAAFQGDLKPALAAKQQHNNSHSRKVPKPLKSFVKAGSEVSGETLNLPRKSMSEEKSSIFVESEKFAEKNSAVEDHRSFKSIKESATKKPGVEKKDKAMGKFKFVNEDRERTELLLPKKFLKSALVGPKSSDANDLPDEQLLQSKSMTIASPKSSFCKRSSHALGDSKVKAQSQAGKAKKPSGSSCKVQKSPNNAASKSARNEERSDDSDESGMSFLMKRYLEASSEVAKKFSECQRLASATRNSSVQVDMSEKADRKPPKKMQKYAPFLEKSAARKKLY